MFCAGETTVLICDEDTPSGVRRGRHAAIRLGPGRLVARRATRADRDGILRLAQAAHAETPFGAFPFDPAKFDVAFEAAMSHPKSQAGVVVELGGRIVGFGHFRCGPYYLSSDGVLATVQARCVDHMIRRTLLSGRVLVKLVRALERWSEAIGARATTVAVTSGHDADGLGRRLGATGWEMAGPTLLRVRR